MSGYNATKSGFMDTKKVTLENRFDLLNHDMSEHESEDGDHDNGQNDAKFSVITRRNISTT